MYSFTISNYKDYFFFSDKYTDPITLKVSQEFINGFMYALLFTNNLSSLKITTDGILPDKHYFDSLTIIDKSCTDEPHYNPSYDIYGDNHQFISKDKLHDRVAKYNSYYPTFLASKRKVNNVSLPFTAIIRIYNYEEQYDWIFQFGSADFLMGFRTLSAWNRGSYHQFSNIIDIDQVHMLNKLCYTFIKHNITPDYSSVEKLLNSYLISDLTKIVIEYFQELCQYYSNQICDRNIYLGRFIQCVTPCEIGQNVCEACKAEDGLINKPFEVRFQLEFATD